MATTHPVEPFEQALERARLCSPFLKGRIQSQPALAEVLAAGRLTDALEMARLAGRDASDVMAALRHERNAFALALAVGDLAGALSLEEVVGELSDLADRSLERAIATAIEERTPGAEPRGFVVIALGKHGSRELNYSSDIDPLFLFDPATIPLKPREEPAQGAVRIGGRVAELMQKRDANGHVFRIDLRLRPAPEVTPIALSVDAAISHYESSALPWERAAFIRARIAAGDRRLGTYFLEAIHPFVWRRSLDFGAIGEIQSITRRIRGHYAQGQAFGPGYDLKRGRGGIREIEFFAQIHQLIHGGREPGLRAPATLDALAALAEVGRIGRDEAEALAGAYRLLRTIEHRLQMVEDRQTHSLPKDAAALDNVARLHGLGGGGDLLRLLAAPVARVGEIYDRLGGGEDRRLPNESGALRDALAGIGFRETGDVAMRIEGWRSGKARSLRTTAAMDAFEAMLPTLLAALVQAPDPLRAVNRFDDVVARLPSGVNLYRLIEAQPGLARLLATVLSHAPVLADQLGRRPELLDGLISKSAFEPAPPVAELIAELERPERAGEDYQMLLDRVRRRVNEARFALGVQLVTGSSDPLDVAGGYARIAEAALGVLASATAREFTTVHGIVPQSELLILALGRLGGEALTHASDLDLIYLFTGDFEARSEGAKPLGATDYYNRLAARVTSALSVATAAGPLYEVDTRLRPSGKDGLIAVSLGSFAEYQEKQAWTWEHMALTRGRPIFGSPEARAAVQEVIDRALHRPRDPVQLTAETAAMRGEIAAHKQPSGPYDIKLGPGGLVDLEFAVQTLQLRERKAFRPQLGAAIAELIEEGLIPADIAEAHRLLTRMLVMFRLVAPESNMPPEASRPLVAAACGIADWDALLAAHDEARQRIGKVWQSVGGG